MERPQRDGRRWNGLDSELCHTPDDLPRGSPSPNCFQLASDAVQQLERMPVPIVGTDFELEMLGPLHR